MVSERINSGGSVPRGRSSCPIRKGTRGTSKPGVGGKCGGGAGDDELLTINIDIEVTARVPHVVVWGPCAPNCPCPPCPCCRLPRSCAVARAIAPAPPRLQLQCVFSPPSSTGQAHSGQGWQSFPVSWRSPSSPQIVDPLYLCNRPASGAPVEEVDRFASALRQGHRWFVNSLPSPPSPPAPRDCVPRWGSGTAEG